jgi:hypothetical protein
MLNYSEINKPVPVIKSVTISVNGVESAESVSPLATESVKVKANIGNDAKIDSVILYYAKGSNTPFEIVNMTNGGKSGDYIGEIPPCPSGSSVHYYIEARSVASLGSTAFEPAKSELGAFNYKVKGQSPKKPKEDNSKK